MLLGSAGHSTPFNLHFQGEDGAVQCVYVCEPRARYAPFGHFRAASEGSVVRNFEYGV